MMNARSAVVWRALVAATLASLTAPSAMAQQVGPKSHQGEFVSADKGEFTMTMGGQMPHQHKVTDSTHYRLNGKDASLGELKQGDLIKVTTENGKTLAVEATRTSKSPAQ